MKRRIFLLSLLAVPAFVFAEQRLSPADAFTAGVARLAEIYSPKAGSEPQTFSTTLRVLRAPVKELAGREVAVTFQAPDRLLISADVNGGAHMVARDGGEVWFFVPGKKWGVIGKPGVARFAGNPASVDATVLPSFSFPEKAKVALLPLLCTFEEHATETVGGSVCRVIVATPTAAAQTAFNVPAVKIELAIPEGGMALPARIAVSGVKGIDVAVELVNPHLEAPWPAEKWKMPAREGDRVETTAVAHFARFAEATMRAVGSKSLPLPPLDGSRVLVGVEGRGRLELHDGVRVLFLDGTPEEMGRQQGALVKKEVCSIVDRILYGVGVGSSLGKARWFFGEIEEAQGRLQPFMDPRYLREMDALADAIGRPREEVRLANYFPELFHCSGFALLGPATADGHIYHGRVLDYLKGVGLEQNSVVTIVRPDIGNAWVNVGYCGFIGSVTAMNEKGISIGEMGGRGEGHWDGKPMAQLLREIMEKADSLDDAIAILRRGPRTCEYYYVITDAKAKRAVGVKATPEVLEIVEAGQTHPQLPDAVKDCVLLSAGDRYTELVRRAKAGLGKFDAASARDLMTRPVCMGSNIHSVLFAPGTLDFWVANADSVEVASHTVYRKFNLRELLGAAPAAARAGR